MDPTAPHDKVHDHPDFDFHVARGDDGRWHAVLWVLGQRIEFEETGR